jgi:hypothetical protein
MRLILALTLLVSLAPAAVAGGLRAHIEGPASDGVTYTARTYSCDPNDALEPMALAEGVVDGKRRSALIHVEPTSEHGVFTFARSWPQEGRWMIRYCFLRHPSAPATVATLRADGTVRSNKLYFRTDGFRECHEALRKSLHLSKFKEDC